MRGESQHYDSLYDELSDPSLGFIQHKALWLLYLMDLSENLWRTADFVARRIPNGIIALILLPFAYIIANTLGGAAFYFDLDATRDATTPLTDRIYQAALVAGATGIVLKSIQWMPTTFTLFPTAMELLGSKFAKFGTPGWQMAVWVTAFFDLVSDAPRVAAEMTGMWTWATCWPGSATAEAFCAEGFVGVLMAPGTWPGVLLYYVSFLLALISASYVVEVLFICSILVVVMLVIKSVGYWALSLTLGLLSGRAGGVMNFIYRLFGTMEGPPPETGPRAARTRSRRSYRDVGGSRGTRRPTRPPFEDDEDFEGFEGEGEFVVGPDGTAVRM